MPSRKKIHTIAFERLSTRSNRKLNQTRREIAAEAARIMATQAQNNFRLAKQKAAHVEAVTMTPADEQKSRLDKMLDRLNRIHRRVA